MGAPKAYVASMSRVGERGIVSGKFWLADPNEDMAWRNKDWIVEVVDETNEYQKGRHTFEVVFFKIIEAVDGEEAFTQSEEDIQRVNIIYVTQWDVTHKKNHEKYLRNLATLAKAKEIVAQDATRTRRRKMMPTTSRNKDRPCRRSGASRRSRK